MFFYLLDLCVLVKRLYSRPFQNWGRIAIAVNRTDWQTSGQTNKRILITFSFLFVSCKTHKKHLVCQSFVDLVHLSFWWKLTWYNLCHTFRATECWTSLPGGQSQLLLWTECTPSNSPVVACGGATGIRIVCWDLSVLNLTKYLTKPLYCPSRNQAQVKLGKT